MKQLRALGLLIAIATTAMGCHGRAKSAVEWSSKKAPFQAGTVLRHAPECASGRVFLDLSAAEKNAATRAAVEVLATRLIGGMAVTAGDRRELAALRDSLRDEGLDPGRDTKEVALCSRGDGRGLIAVFGGDYSGKDIFRAITAASERLGDKPPRVEERQGIELVRFGRLIVARVAPNVVAMGDDIGLLVSLRTEVDRSAHYNYTPGLVASGQIGNDAEGLRLRVADAGEDVLLDVSVRVKDSAEELERRRSGVASRFDETPLRGLSTLVGSAKVSVAAGRARFEMRGRTEDVANAIQTASELPPAELKRIIAYVFGGADGAGTPEHKI